MTAAESSQPRATIQNGAIALSGRITSRIAGGLMDAWMRMDKAREVVLDFSGADGLEVSGLNVLITLHQQARTEGRVLRAAHLSPGLRDIFGAARIDGAIIPEPSEPAGGEDKAPGGRTWAAPVGTLRVESVPPGAINRNVDGFGAAGPVQGFGRLWHKTYRMRLAGVDAGPREVIGALKDGFSRFQPPHNRFYPPPEGIVPGAVVLINAMTPAGPLYTGVRVLHATDESFTFITPQGHPEAGWVSFDACEKDGVTSARVQGFARASDPFYELAFELMGSRVQERIWRHVLLSLGRHFGIRGYVSMEKSCVGDDYQWEYAGNLRYNAQIRSLGYFLMSLAGY